MNYILENRNIFSHSSFVLNQQTLFVDCDKTKDYNAIKEIFPTKKVSRNVVVSAIVSAVVVVVDDFVVVTLRYCFYYVSQFKINFVLWFSMIL